MAIEPGTVVRMKKDGGPLTLRISIDGLAGWAYQYVTETGTLKGKSTDGGGPERTHPLGTVTSLHLDGHAWTVRVGDVGDDEVTVKVTLTWEQDVDKDGRTEVIHRRESTLKVSAANPADTFKSEVFLVAAADATPLQSDATS